MQKLFLSSSFSQVSHLFPEFMKEKLFNKKVAFIPIASLVEEVDFYVEEARNVFRDWGVELLEINFDQATQEEIIERITTSDMIYVSGGNTFYLLQELRHSGLDRLIVSQIEKGVVYIGESAGSIIMAPHIEYAKLMDDVAMAPFLADYKALHRIESFPLPHVGEFPFVEAAQAVIETYRDQLSLLPINNQQVILVEGDEITIK